MTEPAELFVGLFSTIEDTCGDQGKWGIVKAVSKLIVCPELVLDGEEISVPKQPEDSTQGVLSFPQFSGHLR